MEEKVFNLVWKSVSDINDTTNPKTRGWLIPTIDLERLRLGRYYSKVLNLKLDDLEPSRGDK